MTDYRGQSFHDLYVCSTYTGSAVYANVGSRQSGTLDDSGYMYRSSSVWVICQLQGTANPPVYGNRNHWWLYTQGDTARPNGYHYTHAWGYLPAVAVSQGGQEEPIPGVPQCARQF